MTRTKDQMQEILILGRSSEMERAEGKQAIFYQTIKN